MGGVVAQFGRASDFTVHDSIEFESCKQHKTNLIIIIIRMNHSCIALFSSEHY